MKLKKLLVIGTLVLGVGANTANAYITNYGEKGYEKLHPKLGGITLNENYDEQCEIFKQKLDAFYAKNKYNKYYKFSKNNKECGYGLNILSADENGNVKKIWLSTEFLGFNTFMDSAIVAKAYLNSESSVFDNLEIKTHYFRSGGKMAEDKTVEGINSENQSIIFNYNSVRFEQLPKGGF